ncbi:MAG: selenocysteine-specific translation elongation factor [Verrucomicrobiota bacterium]|nr:selenocysteine-specific translation elongation factor [Verrucomicrobiota bacterium]
MNRRNFILATAGHVDHGKSALVQALTGSDPDRLPAEKARGITIELGFAELELGDNRIGIVDVPGHEDFVRNMVAGVGAIDLALLVVAADDGWMPQTEEHLQILTYLSVKKAVIALTKIDLAESEEATEETVRAQLRGTPFADAPIVRTSITIARGIEELRRRLAEEFASMKAPQDIGKPRLPVDRAFTLRGMGTIVTGTLSGGTLPRGESVVVQPTKIPTRIRALQNHNREVEAAGPAMRTALNLSDLATAHAPSDVGVRRGDVITLAKLGDASNVVDVFLTRSARLPARTRRLQNGAFTRVHHGSGSVAARIFFAKEESLGAGETALAQLRLASPVFIFAGDRFVVRDSSEQTTLAGGLTLDPDGSAKNFRKSAQQEFLQERAQFSESVETFVRTQLVRDRAVLRATLLTKSCFSNAEISEAILQCTERKEAIAHADFIADASWWKILRERASAAIDDEHKLHPDQRGLDLVRLRKALQDELALPAIFDALVAELSENEFVRTGEIIRRAGHRLTLPPVLQSVATRIRAALQTKPFDPPSRRELAPDAFSQQALRFLCETGEAIQIGEDVILSRESFAKTREIVNKFLREKGAASVSELRQTLGSSRRVVVPLLERFDREGFTRRTGDQRMLVARITKA